MVCLVGYADAAQKGMTRAQAQAECNKMFPKGTERGGKLMTIRQNYIKEKMGKRLF